MEQLNPGGSVKDRIAMGMVEEAERSGQLRPGGTIVEPTSGNTGHGLAMVAAIKGYKMIFVMPDKMSAEKISLLKAYGADVVVCPTNVDRESPQSYYSVADRLSREIPGAFQPNQYFNAKNPQAHYETTGPELWRQTEGRITVFVAGVGTGGTISGTGRYLKEQNPAIQVVGADPEGSIFSGPIAPYKIEGVGEDFWPGTFDPAVVDRIIQVTDREAFVAARRLAREEGILVGGSAGMALHAALVVAADTDPDGVIVVLLPDTGRNYLTKFFSDEWMRQNGFLDRLGPGARARGARLACRGRPGAVAGRGRGRQVGRRGHRPHAALQHLAAARGRGQQRRQHRGRQHRRAHPARPRVPRPGGGDRVGVGGDGPAVHVGGRRRAARRGVRAAAVRRGGGHHHRRRPAGGRDHSRRPARVRRPPSLT